MMQVIKDFYRKKKDLFFIISLVILGLSLFFTVTIILKNHNIYELDITRLEDRFYSYDDLHYATRVYSPNKENMEALVWSAVKHPLLIFGANIFASIENTINANIGFNSHYLNIIFFQIIISLIGVVFLYKVLSEIIKIKKPMAFLLSLIYLCSNAIILATVLSESFIISATLLILSYYLISKEKYIASGICGALIFGTTITNVAIWMIMVVVLLGFKRFKPLIKISLSFILTVVILLIIMKIYNSDYINMLYNNFFAVIKINSETFSMKYSLGTAFSYGFYFLFSAAFFYIDTTNATVLGLKEGASISFLPSANLLISALTAIIVLVIFIFAIKYIIKNKGKDKNVIACFLIILFNLLLHVGVKFGLNEAFLYTPHMLFCYIIMLALVLKHNPKYQRHVLLFVFAILFSEFLFNFKSISDMILVVQKLI